MKSQGYAFPEHIRHESVPKRRYHDGSVVAVRNYLLLVVLILSVVFLLFRIFSLQIMNGSYYRLLSDSNRIRTTVIHAPRGIIFDRNGTPLVFNTPGFQKVEVDEKNNGEIKTTILQREDALERIAKGEKGIAITQLRSYPYAESTAHVLGYVGQITKEQLESGEYDDYSFDDTIGKVGIERQYENILSGTDGRELWEVDALGKKLRTLGQTDPIPGQDITLTIDSKLQKAAYEAMKDIPKGAVVATSPTGEILAMISKPSYDPNLFTQDTTYKTATDSAYTTVSAIVTDGQNQPLLNRAIGGVYPPGSTFKIITSAAGLESNKIDENYSVKDTGILRVGEFSYANWYFTQYGKTDGDVDVVKAISRSNDIFFYKLAEKIDVAELARMGEKFGVGKILGVDLPGEVSGVLPTKEWKEKVIGEPWYLGDTFIYGIGQGYLLSTPLQVNSWAQIIAADGIFYRPHLLKSTKPEIITKNLLSEKTDQLIREGMVQACSDGGTAYPFFDFQVKNEKLQVDGKNILTVTKATDSAKPKTVDKDARRIRVACKTGTAEHGGDPSQNKAHAWISVFAPAYNPEIVVTVLAESSGEGSQVAGPIAKDILEAWFTE